MNRLDAPIVVLITGASAGIGAALAREYAAPGRTLLLQGRDPARLEALAAACRAAQSEVVTLQLDIRDAEAVLARIGALAARYPVDLAIVNAGINRTLARPGEGECWDDIDAVVATNLRGALATLTAVLPAMRRRGSGQIALVSSLAGYVGMPAAPAYSATKAALRAYGEALRDPLAARGIALNVVMPGFVRTSMGDDFPGPHPFMLTAESAAKRIRRGLERNRARIAFPFPLSWCMWVLSALPVPVAQALLRLSGFGRRD